MPANDGTPQTGENVTGESDSNQSVSWESVGRKHLRRQLLRDLDRVNETVREMAGAVGDGREVTADDLQAVRMMVANLQVTVEEDVVPLVEDAEAYERPVFSHVPGGVFTDYLERDTGD